MAEQTETSELASDGGHPSSGGGSRLITIVAGVGFVLTVVLVECAVAYFVIPSSADVAAMAQAQLAASASAPANQGAIGELTQPDAADHREVELGDFSVSSYQPLSNTTLRIDLTLFGTVDADDMGELQERVESSKHRFREQVLVTLRSAEMSDLADAGLGLIKRKILETTNRTLGKPLLHDVILSEFSFTEQ